jgi:hypothetical protein
MKDKLPRRFRGRLSDLTAALKAQAQAERLIASGDTPADRRTLAERLG